MRLWYFNPENDVALAAGLENYTARASVMRLHHAGAVLPLWWGDPADMALCYGVNAQWLGRMREEFGLATEIFPHDPSISCTFAPWGWSLNSRKQFLKEGFPRELLPTDSQIAKMRELSHRRVGAKVAQRLRGMLPAFGLAPAARELSSMAELDELLALDSPIVIKMPWSSSGRGVVNTRTAEVGLVRRMAADSLRLQGGVMAEPSYVRALDFAKIYECESGRCASLGTSVFVNDEHGSYVGNLIAPEAERLRRVGAFYPLDKLEVVAECLRQIIEEEIAPHYSGVLGVDMLVDADGMLNPVVEINLRYTMGYAANRIGELHVAPGSVGLFTISALHAKSEGANHRLAQISTDSYKAEGIYKAEGLRLKAEGIYKAEGLSLKSEGISKSEGRVVVDKKLAEGTLELVPPNPYFSIQLSVHKESPLAP